MNQIWHYMAFVVRDQIVAWFYFWVNIFSSQMLNAGKSLKTENGSGTTQGELISGTFLYSVYCSFPLPVICVCVFQLNNLGKPSITQLIKLLPLLAPAESKLWPMTPHRQRSAEVSEDRDQTPLRLSIRICDIDVCVGKKV